jgi:hypothetical protein
MVDNVGSVAVKRLHVYRHWCDRLLDVACRRGEGVNRWHRLTLVRSRLPGAGSQLHRKVMLIGSIGRMASCEQVSQVSRGELAAYQEWFRNE